MSGDKINSNGNHSANAALVAESGEKLGQRISHIYQVECYGPDGTLKWSDLFHNLVTTAGLNKYLDATLKTGLASPAWYVGLITGPAATANPGSPGNPNVYAAADTMGSHGGWAENTTYSNLTRPAWTPGTIAAGSVDNSGSKAVFNINGTATIAGCFMADNSTKGGTSGTLLGEGNFTAGDRLVQAGDTLNVTVTATQS